MKTVHLLMIGNSFSQDASEYMHQISMNSDVVIEAHNLYIGGCSLETHYSNVVNDKPDYIYFLNGKIVQEHYSIKMALEARQYDYVSFQQASHFSGQKETYYPYIKELIKYVREYQPNAKLLMHETWPYCPGSTHGCFVWYNNDAKYMEECVRKAYQEVAKENDLELVEVMEDVVKARQKYGELFSRDLFHLDTKGRYLAGLRWVKFISGEIHGIYDPSVEGPVETGDYPTIAEIQKYIDEII